MKRDMDLVRKLLTFFEEKQGLEHVEVPPIEGYDDSTIKYHLVLLHDAGLLRCEPIRSSTSDRLIYVIPFDLTWQGHEFIGKVKDERVWERVKSIVASKGGTLTFDVVSEIAKRIAFKVVADV